MSWTSGKDFFKVVDNSRAYPTTRPLGFHNFARDVKIQLPADKKIPERNVRRFLFDHMDRRARAAYLFVY